MRFEQAPNQPAELRLLGQTIVPLDLSISFADVPALSRPIERLAVGGTAAYQLDGTVGIDAGRLGTPTFGPMRLTTEQLQVH